MADKNRPLIPKYAFFPVVVYILMLLPYFISRLIPEKNYHDFSLPLDDIIPFVPIFVWIYVFAYLQWFIGYVFIARSERLFCETYFSAAFLVRFISTIIFIIIPSTLTRPDFVADTMSERLVEYIYSVDSADNLLPSLHCAESWLVARAAMEGKASKIFKLGMFIMAILVFCSVVFIKQHVFMDIPAGILLTELSIWITKKFDLGRMYRWLNLSA